MATLDIGTGQTYTSPQLWWNSRAGTLTEPEIGECLAEEFAGAFDMNGKATTEANYGELRAKYGAEHDGRHHALSGLGNARITYTGTVAPVRLRDEHVRLAWMEVSGPGNNTSVGIVQIVDVAAGSRIYVHHNILHNDGLGATIDQHGFFANDADALWRFYRNIIFGAGGTGGRFDQAAANSVCAYNTFYANNRSFSGSDNSRGGVAVGSAADTNTGVRYNAVFASGNLDIRLTRGVQVGNWTGDATGDDEGGGTANAVAANNFVNPTTTWGALDLRLLETAPMRGQGVAEDTGVFPDIDVPINDRDHHITGTWDIGAAQWLPAGGGPSAVSLAAVSRGSRMRRLVQF